MSAESRSVKRTLACLAQPGFCIGGRPRICYKSPRGQSSPARSIDERSGVCSPEIE